MKLPRIHPAKSLLVVVGLAAAVLFVLSLYSSSDSSGIDDTYRLKRIPWIMVVTLSALAIIDIVLSIHSPITGVSRHITKNLSLGRVAKVQLIIRHSSSRDLNISLVDHVPTLLKADTNPIGVELVPNYVCNIEYEVRAVQRGSGQFTVIEFKIPSRFGFWNFLHQFECRTDLKVYPDFVAISGYTLLATDNHVSHLGILQKPRRGQGTEFQQLREYREGDSLRQIDWKSTSRVHKLMSKDYQDERDQNIVLMIDNGRRLRAQDDELSHFDHALNALLLLAYVALKQGDSVGMMSFGADFRWMPPQKGVNNINILLNHFYDLYAGNESSDYLHAVSELAQRQKKRSLIVMVSNLRDEDTDDLIAAAKLLRKRHLLMVANIREPVLDNMQKNEVEDFDGAMDYLSSSYYLAQRKKVTESCIAQGVFTIDCLPKHLGVRVINSYTAMKRAGYL